MKTSNEMALAQNPAIQNPVDEVPHLTNEYHRARNWTVITSASLLAWRLFGIDPTSFSSIGDAVGALRNCLYIPHFVVVGMGYFVVRMRIEWCQSDERRRRMIASQFDFGLTLLFALASIGLSFSALAIGTPLDGVGFVTVAGPVLCGYLFGHILTFLVVDMLTIRSKEEAVRTRTRRIPIAVRGNLLLMIPLAVLLLAGLSIAIRYSSGPATILWPVLFIVTIPLVAIPFCVYELRPQVEALKKASDAHDHMCRLANSSRIYRRLWPRGRITQTRAVRALARFQNIKENRVGIRTKLLHSCVVVWAADETGPFLTLKPKNPFRRSIHLELTFKDPSSGPPQHLKLPFSLIRIDKEALYKAETKELGWKIIGSAIDRAVSDYADTLAGEALKPQSPEEELLLAVEQNDLARVKALVEKDVSPDAEGAAGWRPLILASAQGFTGVARYLLEKGADKNAGNHLGRTALHFAARYGNQEMVKLLLSYAAAMDARDIEQHTPLMFAALHGHTQTVSLLLKHGADPTAKDRNGLNAEQLARAERFGSTARVLSISKHY